MTDFSATFKNEKKEVPTLMKPQTANPQGVCLNESRKGRTMSEMCEQCNVENCRWRIGIPPFIMRRRRR